MAAPRMSLSLLALRARLLLERAGAANAAIAVLVLLAAAVWLGALPYAERRLHSEQQRLADLEQARASGAVLAQAAVAPPRAVNDERMALFRSKLGEREYAEQQLKTLFAIAAKTSLVLQQADYKWVDDGHGRFSAYRVQLPVKGNYAAIQQFCEQVLLAIPFASLDQLNFSRDTVGNNVIDAQLSFTLYLAEPETRGMQE